MDHEDALERTLPTLNPRLRAKFAGLCAERCRMVYESVEPDNSDFFFDGLAFVWAYERGQGVNIPNLEQMILEVQTLYDDKMEAEESGPDTDGLRSLLGAMRSVLETDIEPAEDASFFAVDMAGNTCTSKASSEKAQAEEEEWQLAVLEILRDWPLDHITFESHREHVSRTRAAPLGMGDVVRSHI